MTVYTVEKVKSIIKNYHHNITILKEYRRTMKSVGVAQSGIESVMPKAQGGTSDPTGNEAVRLAGDSSYFAELATDIKYLQDRLDRVPKKYERTLDLTLSGHSVIDIANLTHRSVRAIYRELNCIAECIVSQT